MNASPAQILVLGSANVDLVIRGPRLPAPGETVLGGEFYQAPGGKGANQAVAAARLARGPVVFVAALGDDALGQSSRAGFASENLVLDYVSSVPGQSTGVALIMVNEQGENCISVASGANAYLTPADVDRIPESVFRSGRVFLACLESPLMTVERGLTRARRAGLTTILNPAPANAAVMNRGWLQGVDILTPNEAEAGLLTGIAIHDLETATAAARRIQSMGCRAVVITLGKRGAIVVEADVTPLEAWPVTAIDTTAAGDAFNGALAVAISEDRPLLDAARWATIVAAISVTRRGAQPSLPTRAEVASALAGDQVQAEDPVARTNYTC